MVLNGQVTNNNDVAHADEAASERAIIIGAHHAMGIKQMQVDLGHGSLCMSIDKRGQCQKGQNICELH